MKKFINDPAAMVEQTLAGFAAAHDDLVELFTAPTFVARSDAPLAGKVALVSGGGSGHEPLHVGYVGPGMLDAAVPGQVFTSPTPDQIQAAVRAVAGAAGVLLIVKNYTGDVLNFEMAAEMLRADGIPVATIVVADDVAVQDSTFTAGRRGLGGTVLVEKIAGAAADRGDDLAGVTAAAAAVAAMVRSMAVALGPAVMPQSGEPSFVLNDAEIEMGVGIHGEPGRERAKMASADDIVGALLTAIVDDLPLLPGGQVLLFVNGLGGTPQGELYLAYDSARRFLAERGIRVTRSLVGNYLTALEMPGLSITVLALDEQMTMLWDAPVHTAALRWRK